MLSSAWQARARTWRAVSVAPNPVRAGGGPSGTGARRRPARPWRGPSRCLPSRWPGPFRLPRSRGLPGCCAGLAAGPVPAAVAVPVRAAAVSGLAVCRPAGPVRAVAASGLAVCRPAAPVRAAAGSGLAACRPAGPVHATGCGLAGLAAGLAGQGLLVDQDAEVRGGAVPGAGCAGVQRGLAGGGQAVHPPLGRGPGIFGAARRAERMHGGLDDLPGQGVPARTGDRAGVIEGEPERQVPALEPFAFPLLNGLGVGAVEQFLAQAAQRARVQPGNAPASQGTRRTRQRLLVPWHLVPRGRRRIRWRLLTRGSPAHLRASPGLLT